MSDKSKNKSEKIIGEDLISFDYAIKYLLKSKSDFGIIEGFISAILSTSGYSPVKITARLDGESEKEGIKDKGSLADVIVADEQGEMYIVEIDRATTEMFMHKACFNASRLVVDSIGSGEDYSQIKKVIHINVIYFSAKSSPMLSTDTESTMQHGRVIFHEIDREHPQNIHLEDLGARAFDAHDIFPEYFVITVPIFDGVVKSEIDEWLYVLKYSKIPEGAKSPYMKKVAERLSILKMSRAEKQAYMDYRGEVLKQRDYLVAAEAKGEAKEKIKIAKSMLAEGMPIDIIAKITHLPKEEITKLKDKL